MQLIAAVNPFEAGFSNRIFPALKDNYHPIEATIVILGIEVDLVT